MKLDHGPECVCTPCRAERGDPTAQYELSRMIDNALAERIFMVRRRRDGFYDIKAIGLFELQGGAKAHGPSWVRVAAADYRDARDMVNRGDIPTPAQVREDEARAASPGAQRLTCYQCDKETTWLAPDSRCGECTHLTAEEIR